MDMILQEPAATELEAIRMIRAAVMQKIEAEGWDKAVLANKMGLVPLGVEFLLEQRWSLDTAWRVAHALGVPVSVSVPE